MLLWILHIQVISWTVKNLERPEHLTPYLQHIGALHVHLAVERGFSSDLWSVFRSAIQTTMSQRIAAGMFDARLEQQDRSDALAAWTNMSMLIVQTMHQGYAQGIRHFLATDGTPASGSNSLDCGNTHPHCL